jgi:hypothetical protein
VVFRVFETIQGDRMFTLLYFITFLFSPLIIHAAADTAPSTLELECSYKCGPAYYTRLVAQIDEQARALRQSDTSTQLRVHLVPSKELFKGGISEETLNEYYGPRSPLGAQLVNRGFTFTAFTVPQYWWTPAQERRAQYTKDRAPLPEDSTDEGPLVSIVSPEKLNVACMPPGKHPLEYYTSLLRQIDNAVMHAGSFDERVKFSLVVTPASKIKAATFIASFGTKSPLGYALTDRKFSCSQNDFKKSHRIIYRTTLERRKRPKSPKLPLPKLADLSDTPSDTD